MTTWKGKEMGNRSVVFAATIVFILSVAMVAVSADDPFNGTWRLDPSRNEDSNPNQVNIRPQGNGLSVQINDQKSTVYTYGQDSPTPDGTVRTLVRVSDHRYEITTKKDGKIIDRSTVIVSTDGKHQTQVKEWIGVAVPHKLTTLSERIGPAAAGDAFFGSWRQNTAKTIFDPPQDRIIRIGGGTIDYSQNIGHVVTAKFDGKDYKLDSSNETVRVRRINPQMIEWARKTPSGSALTEHWEVKGNLLISTVTGN